MKKFIISSEVLKKALGKLNNAVPKNPVLTALGSILCRVQNKSVEFICTDLEVTIQYRCECETSGESFEFLLPFQLIHKIIGFSKNVPLTFSQDKNGIKITGDNDVYELKNLTSVEEFPKVPIPENKSWITITEEVLRLMSRALDTVSKDESRLQLMNVLLELRKEKTTIASTDGSYSVFSFSLPNEIFSEDDLLVGPKVIKALDGLSDIQLSWNNKNFVFLTPDVTVTVTKPNMKFVNFRAIFPADFPSNLKVNRTELIHALEKCNINSNALKETDIDLKTIEGKIVFLAKDTNYNIDINVGIDGHYTGPVSSIRFSSEKMLKLVNQVDFEDIELAIHEPNKAILFRSPDHEGYLSLLMPIFSNQ